MNKLEGKITSVETEGELSLVKVNVGEIELTSIIIDTPQQSKAVVVGNTVDVLFKETEVLVSIDQSPKISLQNQLHGKIVSIESNYLLSKITVDSSVGIINSIITSNAVKQLGLQVGSSVVAMVKTNEVMLSF